MSSARCYIDRIKPAENETSTFTALFLVAIVALVALAAGTSTPAHAAEVYNPFNIAELSAETTTQSDFHNQGIQAFNAGDYEQAVRLLEQAFVRDDKNPKIIFNLASAYYKAERYEEAFAFYPRLIIYPSYKPLAFYQLGLTAIKLTRYKDAIYWFRKAIDSTSNENLAKLAQRAITRINESEQAEYRRQNWRFSVALTGGFDDNVSLSNLGIDGVIRKDDNFTNLTAGASGYLLGNVKNGLFTSLYFSQRSYEKHSDYDYDIATGKLAYDFRTGRLYNRLYSEFQQIDLGEFDYQTVVSSGIHSQILLENQRWFKAGYRFYNYTADFDRFEYLDGDQHIFELELRKRTPETDYKINYQFEINDRENLQVGIQYFDASPFRHTLSARMKLIDYYYWDVSGELNYRISFYDKNNVFLDGSSEQRQDNRFTVALMTNYWFNSHWSLVASYQYSDNNSNIDVYTYNRNIASIGVTYKY